LIQSQISQNQEEEKEGASNVKGAPLSKAQKKKL
jgi:hypothetical protein